MSSQLRLAVDAMGGDLGPRSVVPACIRFLKKFPQAELKLFGPSAQLQNLIDDERQPRLASRLEIVPCEQVITQSCNPLQAVRHKRDSSMACALQSVASGEVQAMVTSGNTGALLALSRNILGNIEGVRKPALGKALPTERGFCYLLDLGANIDCSAEDLLQFARMGIEAQRIHTGRRNLAVALLNIGAEPHKGTEEIRRAAELFEADPKIHYAGFVEGHDIFTGVVDVVVCDGLMGNVAMKSAEGVIRLMGQKVFTIEKKGAFKRFFGQLAIKLLRKWRTQVEPARYNGACFLGVRGNVIKSHGGASSEAFYRAMITAKECAEADLAAKVGRAMAEAEWNRAMDKS
ncbi:phosphate acyltransferase PlsX [Microbulbifer thermotolerans]|uniref:Phosphate acyltransferase n=1 Tax=Microbulbifer thermotolerans TaxID=252514 RepID=A0A143HLA3_MICTH|nr:phosphate acyltransferase PlsX [Microbulbifer thermotolerans]AMX02494.1 phosphate acyltransferase [Microbulbifer thermotolerans]MCX2779347.1 phosphate acyltransferase PlsX [Microbulbifer thermotolerans]MCX2795034.1 phosphate acyltransferase PlsX [Microbulbifer thermotolerans]MCX2800602.1 phosphate acyltransferase PlsX [Microbulbifer thermotolerans]MCX2805751.1 phosphate acyltransferase PlsX [Microbulbifer thermotolerans]